MKVLTRLAVATVLLALIALPAAADYKLARAIKDLERAFKHRDKPNLANTMQNIREREEALTKDDAEALRGRATELMTAGPKKLPELETANQGASKLDYKVTHDNVIYHNYALLDLPEGIAADKPVPLCIGLHSFKGTSWYELSGLRSCIRARENHPLADAIIACPQALNRGTSSDDPADAPREGRKQYFGWGPDERGVATVIRLLEELTALYNIDRDRVYLTGIGMGGEGAFFLASVYPSLFAAICPRDAHPPLWYPKLEAGDAQGIEKLRKAEAVEDGDVEFPWLESLRQTRVCWVHADGDRVYPTSFAKLARKRLDALGGKVDYHEYEGFHASGSTALISEALAGMASTSRPADTGEVYVRASTSAGVYRNRWLEIVEPLPLENPRGHIWAKAAAGWARAKIDREKNRIVVECDRVSSLRFHLDDGLIDLNRPIVVVVNGKEKPPQSARRLNSTIIDTALNFSRSGNVYFAEIGTKAR